MEGLEAVLKAGGEIGDAKGVPNGVIPYAVIPEGASLEDLERLLPAPVRARGTITAASVETFNAYLNRFKSAATVVFANPATFVVVGIIDYHTPTKPAFADHWLTYSAPRSLEWAAWKKANSAKMEQAAFAQFIEDNFVDIRTPPGAEVLEVARNLQAKKAVEFSSAMRLADGAQQFTYNETVAGTSAKGTIKVPEEFTLGIRVFFGGPLYEVRARLRYRIDSGKLSLWYDLYRPEYIEKDAFNAVLETIGEATSIEVWEGAP